MADAAEEDSGAASGAGREVFERLERDPLECQEMLCQMSCHWLLSADHEYPVMSPSAAAARPSLLTPPPLDVATATAAATPGLISSFSAHQHSRIILLFPADDARFAGGLLDMREVLYGLYPVYTIEQTSSKH